VRGETRQRQPAGVVAVERQRIVHDGVDE